MITEHWKQQNQRKYICRFTGELLGGIITLLLRNNEFDKADEAMEILNQNQDKIVGVPKLEALSLYVDECIKQKLPSKAIVSCCIELCKCGWFYLFLFFILELHSVLFGQWTWWSCEFCWEIDQFVDVEWNAFE